MTQPKVEITTAPCGGTTLIVLQVRGSQGQLLKSWCHLASDLQEVKDRQVTEAMAYSVHIQTR